MLYFCTQTSIVAQAIPLPASIFENTQNARQLYQDGSFRAAYQELALIIAADPNNHEANFYLGRIAAHQERWVIAAEYLEKAVSAQPKHSQYLIWYAQAFAESAKHSDLFTSLGKGLHLKSILEKAVENSPEDTEVRRLLAAYLLYAPGIAGGDRHASRKHIEIIFNQDKAFGTRLFAQFEDAEKNPEKALYFFKLSASYKRSRSFAALSDFLMRQGKKADAINIIKEHLDESDRLTHMQYLLGYYAAETGQILDEGLACLDDYIASTWEHDLPSHAKAYYQKARIYLQLGQKTDAELALKESLTILPGFSSAVRLLASL